MLFSSGYSCSCEYRHETLENPLHLNSTLKKDPPQIASWTTLCYRLVHLSSESVLLCQRKRQYYRIPSTFHSQRPPMFPTNKYLSSFNTFPELTQPVAHRISAPTKVALTGFASQNSTFNSKSLPKEGQNHPSSLRRFNALHFPTQFSHQSYCTVYR